MIERCVKAYKTREELINASFFVISSNIMIKTNDDEWYPLEIGICEYSIKDGIKSTYHQFVDPGGVPIGYMSMAKSWSNDYHKIPFDNFLSASNKYQNIVEDIIQILNNSRYTDDLTGTPSPMLVFCIEDQIEQNKGVLEWLAKKYINFMPNFEWDLEILDLAKLICNVSNSEGRPIPIALAEHYLTTSVFDYSAETNCDFHEEIDNKECARGGARRNCYKLTQALCDMFEIEPTTNHLPPRRDNILSDTYMVDLINIPQPPANRYQRNDKEESGARTQTDEAHTSRTQPRIMGLGRGRGWSQR